MFARYSRAGVALMGVPLYAGPLLAGWSNAPPALAAALAALFFLMQLLAGKTATRGDMPEATFLALLAAVQIVVVAVVYSAGALLALAMGPLALPLWLPLALTAAGVAIGVLRYRHDPKEAEIWDAIDKATRAIESGAPVDFGDEDPDGPEQDPDPERDAAVQEALDALWTLPQDATVSLIDPVVQRLEQKIGYRGFHGLLAEVDEGFRTVDLAMLRYLASPAVRAELVNSADLGFALVLLVESGDAGVMHELGILTAALLDEGAPASELPPPEALRARVRDFPDLAPLVEPVEEEYRKWRAAYA